MGCDAEKMADNEAVHPTIEIGRVFAQCGELWVSCRIGRESAKCGQQMVWWRFGRLLAMKGDHFFNIVLQVREFHLCNLGEAYFYFLLLGKLCQFLLNPKTHLV